MSSTLLMTCIFFDSLLVAIVCTARDAREAFQEAEDTVAELEDEHAKRKQHVPSGPASTFKAGCPVWVERSRPLGTHRTKTWYTPGILRKRIGDTT